MCFLYIIKCNVVAKTWKLSVVFIKLLTIFICLAKCHCGFWLFCCCKTFDITEILW